MSRSVHFVRKMIAAGMFYQLMILCVIIGSIGTVKGNDSIPQTKLRKELSHDDLKKGERLFYGLVSTGKNAQTCVSCHLVQKTDSFTWNPSAYEIAKVYVTKSDGDLKSALLTPSGKKMTASHMGYELTDEQISQIHGFLNEFAKEGGEPHKPVITKRLIYIGLILLILLLIADAIYTKILRYKAINLFFILVAGFFITRITVVEAVSVGRSQNYSPDQPIKFSHAVHVGQNKIDCLYCHASAEYSKVAGIPSTNVCLNCHSIVRDGSHSGKFEINKIHAAVDNNKPIEWIKIHNLPDHVFFSHAQHVSVGKIACQTCHGDVQHMDRMKQVSDLSMGWCVNCHRKTEVQFNNAFYDKYEKLHKDLKEGKIDKVTAAKVGGTDCMKCHY